MAKLSEMQKRDYPEILDNIEAVLKLARANFPRTNEVHIETVGCSPKASISVPYYVLQFLIEAGRLALSDGGGK